MRKNDGVETSGNAFLRPDFPWIQNRFREHNSPNPFGLIIQRTPSVLRAWVIFQAKGYFSGMDQHLHRKAPETLHQAAIRFLTPRPTPATPRDLELLEKGTGLELGCGLAATAWGEGPTVLLAHGWESRRSHWAAFIPSLVEAGHRVVAIDAPAHGDSPGERVNVLQYGKCLVDVGNEIGPLAGIIGHSFGAGAISVALFQGLVVKGAVLISGPSNLPLLIERWGRGQGISESDLPDFLKYVGEEVGVAIEDLDLARLAPHLKVPALIIHDKGDEDVPLEEGIRIAERWQGARQLITHRYGHRRILIAKEVVREAIGFIQKL